MKHLFLRLFGRFFSLRRILLFAVGCSLPIFLMAWLDMDAEIANTPFGRHGGRALAPVARVLKLWRFPDDGDDGDDVQESADDGDASSSVASSKTSSSARTRRRKKTKKKSSVGPKVKAARKGAKQKKNSPARRL